MNQTSFEAAIKENLTNSKGEKYKDFRNSLKPNFIVAWFDICAVYIALGAILTASVYLQKYFLNYFWVLIPLQGLAIGYVIAVLNLFMHEASHYNLALDRKMNDLLSNIFIGLLIGMEVDFYRSVHFAHHRLIGTKNDTEKSYLEGFSFRFLFEALTGIRLLKVLIHRSKDIKLIYGNTAGEGIIKKNNQIFLAASLLHIMLVAGFAFSGYWQVSFAWLLGMAIFFPFFAMFRQILEHRKIGANPKIDYTKTDHGAAHRMFGVGPVASTLGAAGFNRHLLHHWDPQVSYTRLKDLELFLMDTPLRDELQKSRTTYIETFIELFDR